MPPIMKIRNMEIPRLTLVQINDIAEEIRTLVPGTPKYKRAVSIIATSLQYVQDALPQLLWWAGEVQPEAPPDMQAEVIEFKPPREKLAPYLVL